MAAGTQQDTASRFVPSAAPEASTGSKTGTEAGSGAESKASGKKNKKTGESKKGTKGSATSATRAGGDTPSTSVSQDIQLQPQALRSRTQWCELSGFSRFSSRQDVLRPITHPDVMLHELHQELDQNLYPTGKWVMLGEVRREGGKDAAEEAGEGEGEGEAAAADNDSHSHGGGARDRASNGTDADSDENEKPKMKLPSEVLRPKLLEHYSNGHKIQLSIVPHEHVTSTFKAKRRYVLARDFNITPSTLRLHGVSVTAGIEHLKFFFEDFDLSLDHKAFERLKVPDRAGHGAATNARFSNQRGSHHTRDVTFSWLVRFQTPTEAERAFFTLDNATFNGNPIQMFRYT